MKKKDFKYHGMALVIVIGATLFGFYGMPYIQNKLTHAQTPSKPPPIIFSEVPIITYFNFEKPTIPPIKKPDLAKIIQEKQPKINPSTAKEIATAVEKYSKKFNFPPELIICLIERESSFKPMAVSKSNCKGLMQINQKFHLEKLKKLNIKGDQIFHIDNNINVGVMILKEYYNKTGSISGALKRYLGANSKGYMLDILASFTDLMIKQK